MGPAFFEGLIRSTCCTISIASLCCVADAELSARRLEVEEHRLDQERARMSSDEVNRFIDATRELHRRQETPDTPEALATIPMLQRSDLEPKIKTIPVEISQTGESTILYHDLSTNGILYLDLGFNLRALKQEYLPYVPVFSRALLETGTAEEDFVQV